MSEPLSLDQKMEILKIASHGNPIGIEEKFRSIVSLITEDRCRKCRNSLKNVLAEAIEPHGVRTG